MIDLVVCKGKLEQLLALPAYDCELIDLMRQMQVSSLDELNDWTWISSDVEALRQVLPHCCTISQLQLLSIWVLESQIEHPKTTLADTTLVKGELLAGASVGAVPTK